MDNPTTPPTPLSDQEATLPEQKEPALTAPQPGPAPASAPSTTALPRPEVNHFPWSMRVLGVIYALAALVFIFYPSQLIYLLNVGPKAFNFTQALADPLDRYWLVMAASSMAMLSALSFLAAESPKTRGYSLVHLLAKAVTLAGFAYMFINENRYFAYLVGGVADALIALVVLRSMIGRRKTA